ncbi:hypothetical protein GCM10010531_18870 [Blastococcus jejuensis]|uniref:Hemerythrin HHE cation binding domain-containing protein n=1 Tax=Blastococcus jejuensis TaxID=351224 RepID=A0ABP6P5W0_9ACTN
MTCGIEVPRRAHEQLRLGLMTAGSRMLAADGDADFREAHAALAAFCASELVPHLEADERWLVRAGSCPEARLLATAMRAEARALTAAVGELAAATDPCGAAAAARVVHALLSAHINHTGLLAEAIGPAGNRPRQRSV